MVGAKWQVGSRVYFDHYAYDGDYVFDYRRADVPQLVVNRDFARGDWWGAELKGTRKLARRHTLTAGIEYRDNFRQHQYNYDEQPYEQYLDDRRQSYNWALYVQDEMVLHERLILNAGLRHDHYDTFGGTTNPRIGLIYKPFEKTTVKLLHGAAFRAPNAYELFWRQSGVSKANPRLAPETNDSTELVVERYIGNRLRVGAIGFYYHVNDLITQQTDPEDDLLVYNNVDSMRAKGLELEAETKSAAGYHSRVSYTFQSSRDTQTWSRLTNSPRHLAQLNLMAPLAVTARARRRRAAVHQPSPRPHRPGTRVGGDCQRDLPEPDAPEGLRAVGQRLQPVRQALCRPRFRGAPAGGHRAAGAHLPRQAHLQLCDPQLTVETRQHAQAVARRALRGPEIAHGDRLRVSARR